MAANIPRVPSSSSIKEESSNLGGKLVIVMVGLPARGKTYLARKVSRFLNWLGYVTRVFNVGNYRRARFGTDMNHNYFSADNSEALEERERCAREAMEDLIGWLTGPDPAHVAVFDATNTTTPRRVWANEVVKKGVPRSQVIFIETISTNEKLIEANIEETKLSAPEYKGKDPQKSIDDFKARIEQYKAVYEPMGVNEADQALSFVQLIDVGRQVVMNRVHGYLATRVLFYCMNQNITPRPIYLTRHGESIANVAGTIGGDPELTQRGMTYSVALARFFDQMEGRWADTSQHQIWTSTLQRTHITAAHLKGHRVEWKALDEIDAGTCDGLTYAQIKERFPEEFAARSKNKLNYRYPQGESYQDVIRRLEPVLVETERQVTPVIIVSHQAVLRCLYAYFLDQPVAKCPTLAVPLHTVMEIVPKAYGAQVTLYSLLDDDGNIRDTPLSSALPRDMASSALAHPYFKTIPSGEHSSGGETTPETSVKAHPDQAYSTAPSPALGQPKLAPTS